MLVRATKQGYYGHKRVKKGETFKIKGQKEFSENWMQKFDKKAQAKAASIPAEKIEGVEENQDVI